MIAVAQKRTWGWNSFLEFRDSVYSIQALDCPAPAGCLSVREATQQNPLVYYSKLFQPNVTGLSF